MPPDELDELDKELQEALGDTSPEALIEFGQSMGGITYLDALTKLHRTAPQLREGGPRPFSGPIVDRAEEHLLRQHQTPEQPTHVKAPPCPDGFLGPRLLVVPPGHVRAAPPLRNLP